MSENPSELENPINEATSPDQPEAAAPEEYHSKLAEKVVKYGLNKGIGAAAGAALGSAFGPVGTGIGGFLGWLAAEALFEEREAAKQQ